MNSGNIIMLLGNHEKMCLDTLGSKPIAGSRGLWRDNGGSATYRQLIYLCDSEERARKRHTKGSGVIPKARRRLRSKA